ncbi:hypothetical protein ACQP3C_27855, partial [Escherichia coli]
PGLSGFQSFQQIFRSDSDRFAFIDYLTFSFTALTIFPLLCMLGVLIIMWQRDLSLPCKQMSTSAAVKAMDTNSL